MSNKKLYIYELNKILAPIGYYVWKPIKHNDIEDRVDYIHFKIVINLTIEYKDLIISAGNLNFVYSIDMNVDPMGNQYLFIQTTNLKKLLMLKDMYLEKQLEINIHLNHINDKINKYS